MKKTVNKTGLKTAIVALCLLPFAGLFSCDGMLETDTEHYLDTNGYELNSPNDTLYSMVGILRKMQAIADRYVLVGELRGDLMDITENADRNLQAIYNFDFGLTDKNPYIDTKAYYDIINNCNFFIRRADTTATVSGQKVMIKELAAVQTIRAWVYMQLILNYGKACYYEEPILKVEDMNKIKNDPSVWISDLPALFDRVEDRLKEAREVQRSLGNPSYEGISMGNAVFIPAVLVLGDFYLYTGNPALAATQYHDYLYTNRLRTIERRLRWLDAGFINYSGNFSDMEWIAGIRTSTENETGSYLMGWCYPSQWSNRIDVECTYQLRPSPASINIWHKQDYAFLPDNATPQEEPTYTTGDLRGAVKGNDGNGDFFNYYDWQTPPYRAGYLFQSCSYFITSESDTLPFISIYGEPDKSNFVNYTYIYRTGSVYLRYLEALNRLNKPTVAFAILKYGTSNRIFADPAKVNPDEVASLPEYCNFPEVIFPYDNQRGFHSRGAGASDRNAYYVIPEGVDTVRFVDELICEEMAMETAFEGNRFHDLMRFAKYYGNEFLADLIARRRGEVDPALKAKLMDEKNWYLPHN
ncbi:MAG: RagB/SusD family nutrient uptake outer membrane protein [Dysgonamonadaceae bacterium]|jgi:hypothetical protein|nr:RagB/SusD family nutrient uptake outer membrane protein [Dysgonamonadaceae bacterium]